MTNDEHNVEEFLKALSLLSRKYGLILSGDNAGYLSVYPLSTGDKSVRNSYRMNKWEEICWRDEEWLK